MGILTDITAKANNTLAQSRESKKLGKERSGTPHFMSPTISSNNQSGRTPTNTDDRTATPISITSAKDRATSWMVSAKRVVGISYVGDGIPRSKKEGKSLQKVSSITGMVSQKIVTGGQFTCV